MSERVQYYDKDGKLITEDLKDYSRKNILSEYATLNDFLTKWNSDEKRKVIIEEHKLNKRVTRHYSKKVITNILK